MTSRVAVHVTASGFFEACRAQDLDAVVSLTTAFDSALARHAPGWEKPSADEAVFVGEIPSGELGTKVAWAEALRSDVGALLSLPVSVGIAGTRFAARVCARLASPSGILLWMDGHEATLIGGLPLEELDELRDDQLGRLRARGVRTIDELARLEPPTARELLGSEGDKLLGLVRGAAVVVEPDFSMRAQKEVALLSRRLSRRLVSAKRRARGLELRLAFRDGVTRERYTLLPQPTTAVGALLDAAERLLALCPRRSVPLAGIALSATGLMGGAEGQLDLFTGPPRDIVVCIGRAARDLTASPPDRYPPPTFPGGNTNEENANPVGGGASARGFRGSGDLRWNR